MNSDKRLENIEYLRQWRLRNPDYGKQYKEKNKEKLRLQRKLNYEKNKNREQLEGRAYYWNNRERQLQLRRKRSINNKDKVRAYDQKRYWNNPEKYRLQIQERRIKNPDKYKQYQKTTYDRLRKDPIRLAKRKEWRNAYLERNRERIKEKRRIYLLNNPRSATHRPLEVRWAMNRVRKRDKNTCQWYGCRLTNKQTLIQVHHIFPISEYPQFDQVEEYMICYCKEHHAKWHEIRGDSSHHLIRNSRINQLLEIKNGS